MGENTGAPARGDDPTPSRLATSGPTRPGATPPGPTPPRLTVGGSVSGGRYELLEPHGGVAGQSFWKARDKRLGRNVALTFVDPLPGEQPPGSATGVLDRTVALTAVYSDGLARVLDVIRGRAGGIVVTEWIPGRSLAAAASEPDPRTAVGALWGLSDAATRTEEAGLVLGVDSPDRVRLDQDGRAVLAFPGVSAGADARGDVRGLGAVLYALLTGKWPLDLPEGSGSHDPVEGRPEPAPRDDDKVVDPVEIGSGVSPEAAVLAVRSLDGSAVSSAATVRAAVSAISGQPETGTVSGPAVTASSSSSSGSFLRTATHTDTHTPSHPDTSDATPSRATASHAMATGEPATGAATGPESAAGSSDATAWATDEADDRPWGESADETDPDVQKRRWQIMAGVGAAAVVAIVLLSVWMLGALGGSQNDTPLAQQLDAIERAAQASRASEAAAPADTDSGDAADEDPDAGDDSDADQTADTSPLSVSTVTSWQPAASNGNAENTSSAPNVIDGDPSTSWSTDTYRDQFGTGPSAYKAGIGLMFTLDGEQEVREVELSSRDDIRFEIRSADTATPTSLDDTTRLGSGRTSDGTATVEIRNPREAGYLLVWITRLDTAGPSAYNAEITEVELLG